MNLKDLGSGSPSLACQLVLVKFLRNPATSEQCRLRSEDLRKSPMIPENVHIYSEVWRVAYLCIFLHPCEHSGKCVTLPSHESTPGKLSRDEYVTLSYSIFTELLSCLVILISAVVLMDIPQN